MSKTDLVRSSVLCLLLTVSLATSTTAQEVDEITAPPGVPEAIQNQAIWEANRVIDEQPFEAYGYAEIARLFDNEDLIVLAERSFKTAALLDPSFVRDAQRLKSDLEQQRAHLRQQISGLEETVKTSPMNVDARLRLAKIKIAEGDIPEADKYVRRAAAVDNPAFEEQIDAVGDIVEKAYASMSRYSDVALLDSARSANQLGNYTVATLLYRRLLRRHSEQKVLLSELSAVYANNREYTTALRYLDEANKNLSEREQLFYRNALLVRAGLLSEATS
ncbi:MAG: hypothetical protein HKN13_11580, partial [Rhodothermales bacterium]|nr:hypothetical protein [Rhodothermales bacterium]